MISRSIRIGALIATAVSCSSAPDLDSAAFVEHHITRVGDELRVTMGTGATLAVVHPRARPHPVLELMYWPGKETVDDGASPSTAHHTLKFTLRDLDGFDFSDEIGPDERILAVGEPLLLGPPIPDATGVPDATSAFIECNFVWLGARDRKLLREQRMLSFELIDGVLTVDVHIDLAPFEERLELMGSDEGSLALSVDPRLLQEGERRLLDSEGRQGEQVSKRRARWIDATCTLDGRDVGVAVFDHPSNVRHPAWWNERDDGTVATDPFGAHNLQADGERIGGAIVDPGHVVCLFYRVVVHAGDWDAARIEAQYERWLARFPEPAHGEPRVVRSAAHEEPVRPRP